MLLERKTDRTLNCEYEVWSEFKNTRIYDIDISLIVDSALDYMSLCSLWCFDVWSSNGTTEEDVIEALNREGYIVLINSRANKRVLLTRERLVLGLQKRASMNDMHFNSLFLAVHERHEKSGFFYRLCSASYDAKLCDEILQLAVFGRILY